MDGQPIGASRLRGRGGDAVMQKGDGVVGGVQAALGNEVRQDLFDVVAIGFGTAVRAPNAGAVVTMDDR